MVVLLRRGGMRGILDYVQRVHTEEPAAAAAGAGVGDAGEDRAALSEAFLELLLLLCDSPDSVDRIAWQGRFSVVYSLLSWHGQLLHEGRPTATSMLHRTLQVIEAVGRVATAAGKDLPAAAEAAFDRVRGTNLLVALLLRLVRQGGDAVLLPLALRALAAVRLHTPARVLAAREALGTLVALLVGAPVPLRPVRPARPLSLLQGETAVVVQQQEHHLPGEAPPSSCTLLELPGHRCIHTACRCCSTALPRCIRSSVKFGPPTGGFSKPLAPRDGV